MPARLPSPALDAAAMASHAQAASALLKALAHPARLRVLCRLVEGEASVSELQAKSALSMSALSQHLAVLRQAELVDTRREAQTIFYRLLDSPARSRCSTPSPNCSRCAEVRWRGRQGLA